MAQIHIKNTDGWRQYGICSEAIDVLIAQLEEDGTMYILTEEETTCN